MAPKSGRTRFTVLIGLAPLAACSSSTPAAPDGGSSPDASMAAGDADGSVEANALADAGSGDGAAGQCQSSSSAIVVTTTSVSDTPDGQCDLVEALRAVTTGAPVNGDCPAGSASTPVVLIAGQTYAIHRTLRIDGSAIVQSCGEGIATIVAGPDWTSDPSDPQSSCAILATGGQTAQVQITDVTIAQAPGADLTGACVTVGELQLRRGRVTGFSEGGLLGTCDPGAGCDHDQLSQGSTLRVYNSLVDGNRNPNNGGGVSCKGSGASLIVEHSSIVNNVSDQAGGGIFYGSGWNNQRIANSTVSGNSAQTGGGVYVHFLPCTDTYVYVNNTTIANNLASGPGGGIFLEGNVDVDSGANSSCFTQDVNIFSSIVSNNRSPASDEVNINADWRGARYGCGGSSLVYVAPGKPTPSSLDATQCRFDVQDAMLGPLMGMGGTGNLPVHPLLSQSPALHADVGDVAADQERDGWIASVDPAQPPPWMLFGRAVRGEGGLATDLGPVEMNARWQIELLAVQAKGPAPHTVVTEPMGFDRGAGTSYAATGASGEFVTYVLPVTEAGTYAIDVGVLQGNASGQFQLAIAGDPAGPFVDLGGLQDTYAPNVSFPAVAFPPFTFDAPGQKYLRFTVTGKNPASSAYGLYLDYIDVARM